ncbi:hypothetical protein GCM10026983_13760 [Gracilibacillus alcaliphilus]
MWHWKAVYKWCITVVRTKKHNDYAELFPLMHVKFKSYKGYLYHRLYMQGKIFPETIMWTGMVLKIDMSSEVFD